MDLNVIWTNFLEKIQDQLSPLLYRTWFQDTKLYKLKDGKAYIIVPWAIHIKHLTDNYYDLISRTLTEVVGTTYTIILKLESDIKEEESREEEKKQSKETGENAKENDYFQSNLIKKYTFDNFIVGNSNKFAQAAALSVAENPGNMYNPLFLFGNSGLGKTHLMHAIGNYMVEKSNKKVLYVTSDQFIQDFVSITKKDDNANNFNLVELFKNKYRNIDVLIIDDIQSLSGASASQNEFFNTFNSLYNDTKQIIISSDRSPNDLKMFEDRLKTRFCWGLTVNIFPPDFTLRAEILKKKIAAENFEMDFPDDVIQYIASNISTNVRELEGSITRLVAYSTFMGGAKITLDLAIEALKDYISKGMAEKDDVHRIQRIVAEYFQISVEDIRSKKRSNNIAFPRQIAMYLCRQMTTESFPKIGMEFGGKDHSTVIHSVDKIEEEIKINKDLATIIEKLKSDIGVV